MLDYSSLVPSGKPITSFTLGIAADDFQYPVFGQPFTGKSERRDGRYADWPLRHRI